MYAYQLKGIKLQWYIWKPCIWIIGAVIHLFDGLTADWWCLIKCIVNWFGTENEDRSLVDDVMKPPVHIGFHLFTSFDCK